MTATIEMTTAEKDTLVNGPHTEPYPIPAESTFDPSGRRDAPDLDAIARRLIAIDDLGIGHLSRFRLLVLWAKSGGTSGGKPRWGSVALANPDVKHITTGEDGEAVDAIVRLAADNLREAEATRWQVANELCFQLSRIGLYTTQEGGDERLTLIAPDSAFFTPQIKLFGPQSPELKKTILDIRQTRFEWAERLGEEIAKAEAAKDHDPTLPQAPGVETEAGPVAEGAPPADWAESFDEPSAADVETMINGEEDAIFAGTAAVGHDDRVRANFPRQFKGGAESCRACGLDIQSHAVDFCSGGSSAKRRGKSGANANGHDSQAGNGAETVSGQISASGTNGSHDPDVGALLYDADRVCHALTDLGWSIAYQTTIGNGAGHYVNPMTGEAYATDDVESAYRGLIAGR